MDLLQIAQRVHREALRSGAGPVSIVTASAEQLRIFDAAADSWNELQTLPYNWRWMHRSIDFALQINLGSYNDAYLLALDPLFLGIGQWRRPSDDYTVRAYLTSTPGQVWRLRYVPYDEFVPKYLDMPPANGVPQVWSIGANEEMLVSPKPDVAYTLKADYYVKPTELALDADEPDMPERYHRVLVWRTLLEVAKIDAAPELIARASSNHDLALEGLIASQAERIVNSALPLA